MTRYISMLRGINVSGQKLIKMPELKLLYENLGFTGVVTYIQSGNVIFGADINASSADLVVKIEKSIHNKYGFDVGVIIRTRAEMEEVIQENPFHDASGIPPDKIYVTFMEDEPDKGLVQRINPYDFLPDKFMIRRKEVYLNCSAGYGTTKLSNNFFEKRLKVRATTRNWKTVNNLVELAKFEKS